MEIFNMGIVPINRVLSTGILVFYKRLSSEDQVFLAKLNPYYRGLSDQHKKEFEYRIVLFLKDKTFIAKRFPTVTQEMKILVASSAVQLSFGFTAITLKHFQKIFIYPEAYQSSYSGQLHRGEVNSAGAIVFSWEDFIIGYKNPTDGYNVGLHEMAHALFLEDFIKNGEDDFLDPQELHKFQRTGKLEIAKIRNNEDSFIRDYAATSRDEFFAVCIEQFFEQPEEFKLKLPHLYQNLQKLLNQNPINKENPVGVG